MLTRLSQKARGQVQALRTRLTQLWRHRRRGKTSPPRGHPRNVGSPDLSWGRPGKRVARGAEGEAGRGERSKRRPIGNGADRDEASR